MVKRRIFYENRSVYKDGPPEVAAEKTADERALDQVKTLYEKAGLPETE